MIPEGKDAYIERTGESALNDLIFRILGAIFDSKIRGDGQSFKNAVESLDQILLLYSVGDSVYNSKKNELSNKLGKVLEDKMRSSPAAWNDYYNELLSALIMMIGRTPLVPMRFVEGIIIEDDLNGKL